MASEVTATTTTPAAAAAPARAAAAGFKSSSLWVGDLNPSVSETDLFDIFNAVAPVSSIRVCRNVATRESLGYAYVNFQTPVDAEKAMGELNFSNIKDRACRIMWSQRDPTMRRSNVGNVFVKNLAPIVDARQLHDTFKLFGTILSCKVATDPKGESKGYGFVHFEGDESARAAIDAVNNMDFAGRLVQVMHYLPRQMRSGPEWTNVYAKNLPKNIMVKELNEMFGAFGDVVSAFVAQDENGNSRGFGFVSFKTHAAAQAAVEALNGKELEGAPATTPPARKVKKDKKEGEADAEAEKEAEIAAPTSCKLYVGRAQKKTERERSIRETMEAAKREKAAKWANCNLYVRNLDETVDDELLKKEFQPHGTITSARIERDTEGRSRLFGYVCYSSSEEAAKALQAMQRKLVAGKPLFVTLWQPRDQRVALLAQQRPAGTRAGNAAGANASAANMMAMMQQASTNPAVFQTMMLYVLMAQQAAARGQSPSNQVQQQQLSQALMMNPAAVAIYQQLQNQQMAASRMGGARPGMPAQAAGMPGSAQMTNAAFVATMAAMAQSNGTQVPNFPAQQRGARGPRGQQSTSVVGGARVAAGPAAGQNNGTPRAGPTAAAVAAGVRPATRAVVAPNGQVAGRTGANAGPVYRTGVVRNDGTAPAYDAMAALNGTQAAPAATSAPIETAQNFATQLAAAQPAMRRQMLGERLYSQIASKEPQRAGKITGMLLDGMDEGELLHLLEAPEELNDRISEALGVLHQHELAHESK